MGTHRDDPVLSVSTRRSMLRAIAGAALLGKADLLPFLSSPAEASQKKARLMAHDDEFQLYDLRIEVFQSDDGKPMVCRHNVGDYFELTDDDLISIPAGMKIPLYPLAAILPLLPAKERMLSPNDWMATDAVIACPDPHCGGRFRITRGALRTYRHSEQTVVPLTGN